MRRTQDITRASFRSAHDLALQIDMQEVKVLSQPTQGVLIDTGLRDVITGATLNDDPFVN